MVVIDEKFKKEVGFRLKKLRLDNKQTRKNIVDKMQNDYFICIDEKSIQRYESGENLPKIDNLICFAKIYNVSLDYLIYGKETSDDNSYTYYDNMRRINRLIYSLSTNFSVDRKTGKIYLELWEDEYKVYWERLNAQGVLDNYMFEKRGKVSNITIKELDKIAEDFIEYKEQLLPTKKRMIAFLKGQREDLKL